MIPLLRERGVWVEVTTLVVPGRNDSDAELHALAGWLAAVDRDIPWHVSAFYPTYKMLDVPPTPMATLLRAARIGQEAGLRFIYIGNVPGGRWEDTDLPGVRRVAGAAPRIHGPGPPHRGRSLPGLPHGGARRMDVNELARARL